MYEVQFASITRRDRLIVCAVGCAAHERLRVNVKGVSASAPPTMSRGVTRCASYATGRRPGAILVVATVNDRLGTADPPPPASPVAGRRPLARPQRCLRVPRRKNEPAIPPRPMTATGNGPCPPAGHRRLTLGVVVTVLNDFVEYAGSRGCVVSPSRAARQDTDRTLPHPMRRCQGPAPYRHEHR